MARVSIITPVLEGAADLEPCVACVAGQGVDGLEHLIVLARSASAATMRLALALAERHRHLRLLVPLADGQSRALNIGIDAAAAPVVGILNVDDRYLPGAVARGLAALDPDPAADLVYARCRIVDGTGALLRVDRPGGPDAASMIAGNAFPCNPAAYFYRRILHTRLGPYDEDDELSMDGDFIFRAARHARLRRVDDEWGVFRFAPGTKTWNAMERRELRKRTRRLRLRHFHALPAADQLRCTTIYAALKLRHWLGGSAA